jgi:hypothetical protein
LIVARCPATPLIISAQLPDLTRQLGPAAIDARLDRALRQVQPICDFLIRKLLEIAQDHRRAK